jgi:exopolysaccharide biosynthesis polyprenyl glycosylphosphotransferase
MFRRRKDFLRLRLALTDSVIVSIAFELAYILRQHLPALRSFYLSAGTMAGLLLASVVIWLIAGLASGRYLADTFADQRRPVHGVLRQAFWSALGLVCLLYLFQLGDVSRLFMLLFVTINMLLILACRLWAPGLVRVGPEGAAKRYVIVGTGEQAVQVARLIEADGTGGKVLAFIRDEEGETFTRLLSDHVVDEVIFAIGREGIQRVEELFRICQEEGVKVRLLVNFLPKLTREVSLDRLYDLPLLTFSTAPDNDYLLFLKRLFDIFMSAGALTVLAPVSLLVIALIRLTSKGPIFFVQERCGLNGRRFRLLKFRSMYQDAAEQRASVAALNEMDGPVFKCANDPRITPLGKFLRKFSIDEWPQFVNVIKGDMSLVGPRPPLPEEVEQYEPWQRRRLRMRPGITCSWVIEGRNKLDFLNWMRLDLHYIDHWSLALDCKILLQSIPQVLAGRGM